MVINKKKYDYQGHELNHDTDHRFWISFFLFSEKIYFIVLKNEKIFLQTEI